MTVRWGIAGTGAIAVGFADDLQLVHDAELVAVGSRSMVTAADFAARYSLRSGSAHGSYEDLAADPNVDAVYIATPHSRHEVDTLLFLEAGKHVLCEKPFALSSDQGRRMVAAATERGLFLMEAMWSRFLPPYRVLVDLLGQREIGDPLLVEADLGFAMSFDAAHRLYDLSLGGGGLLDLGVYPVQLASLVLGPPSAIVAAGKIGATGVDEVVAAILTHPGGQLAVVKASITVNLSFTARISGTDGVIELPAFLHCPRSISVSTGGEHRTIDTPWEGGGLHFQVQEVHRCLAEGALQSPTMPHSETLSILETLDAIRGQIGLDYESTERD